MKTLKDFLTKDGEGHPAPFRDLHEAADRMREVHDPLYSSVSSLASLIGQISSGKKAASKKFLIRLEQAVTTRAAEFGTTESENLMEALREVVRRLAAPSKGVAEKDWSAHSLLVDCFDASAVYCLFTDESVSKELLAEPMYTLLERHLSDRTHIWPYCEPALITICVPKGQGNLTWQAIHNEASKKYEPDFLRQKGASKWASSGDRIEELLRTADNENQIRVFEITPIVCWGSAIMVTTKWERPLLYQLFSESDLYPLGVFAAPAEMLKHFVGTIYNRFLDPDDHDLLKKRIPFPEKVIKEEQT